MSIIKEEKYNYNNFKNDLFFLNYEYNNLIIKKLGKSTLKKDIYYTRLGEGKNKILITAAEHADEWCNSLILMKFIEKYLYLYKKDEIYKGYDIKELWQKNSIYIIPMINPDGIDLNLNQKTAITNEKYKYIWKNKKNNLNKWKANIRGVDLKYNYPINYEKIKQKKYKEGKIRPNRERLHWS